MAEKNKGVDVEVDPFADVDDEDEEEEVSENGKQSRKRSPQLLASKDAMEQLLALQSSPRQRGDAETAMALLKAIVYGRLSPQVSAVVKTAVLYDIDAAFAIAHQDWTRGH